MKKAHFTPTLLLIAALLGACSSTPTTTGLLDQARSDYQSVQSNPKTASYAPLEMKQASDAMSQANLAATNNDSAENIDKLAYLAKQKIALTQEVVKRKTAEAEIDNAAKQRDLVRLEQRTNEADQAKRATQIAQNQTQAALTQAAILEAQLAELAARKTERGIVITLGDVLFATDQARLTPDGMRTAQKLADVLQQNPQRAVLIEGFTDSTGTSAHNQELSERRASAVRGTLQEMGVARQRITIRAYGEAYPIAANDTAPSRQLNRRVEIVLSGDDGTIQQR